MSVPPFLKLPDSARQVMLRTARGPLAALESSPPQRSDGAGERSAVLLVPGFGGSKEDFIALLGPLAAAGHHVVAIDLRGQYESPPSNDPAGYDLSSLAADVHAVADLIGEGPVHLLGHSFGGLVTAQVVRADRRAARSLTLMSSGPAALPDGPRAAELRLLLGALPGVDLATILHVKHQLEDDAGRMPEPPDIEEFLDARFLANAPDSLRRMAEQLLAEPDRIDELVACRVPCHVLHGNEDDAWPPEVQVAMAARLGARHTVVAGAGHSPAVDAPTRTADALTSFWAEIDRERCDSPRAGMPSTR